MAADATMTGSPEEGLLSKVFNLESIGEFFLHGIVFGAVSYATWHTGVARPLIDAATPWIVDALEFMHIDSGFEFLSSLVPEYDYGGGEALPIPDIPDYSSGKDDFLFGFSESDFDLPEIP